jgi:hypothetical protein
MNWLVGLVFVLGKVIVQRVEEGHVYQVWTLNVEQRLTSERFVIELVSLVGMGLRDKCLWQNKKWFMFKSLCMWVCASYSGSKTTW